MIIDEMSMVDTWLAHQLLKALPEHVQLIMVGDEDQAPIGWSGAGVKGFTGITFGSDGWP